MYTELAKINPSGGGTVQQVFMVTGATKKVTRTQKPYLIVTVADRTTTKDIKVWGVDGDKHPELLAAKWLKINCTVGEYQGSLDLTTRDVPMIVPPPVNQEPYMNDRGLSMDDVSVYMDRLDSVIGEIKCPYIREYLRVGYGNMDRDLFMSSPASVSNRGAYRGGLVEHVAKVLENAKSSMNSIAMGKHTPDIDRDVVIASVLMHDIGKMYTYDIDDAGIAVAKRANRLIGHLSLSYAISTQTWIVVESQLNRAVPEEIKDHINHCILAHHGQLEYGSPVKPQSTEAYIVHIADMMDSMVSNFAEASMADEPNEDGFVPGTYFSTKPQFVGVKK